MTVLGMTSLSLSTPSGEPLSWLAAVVVAVGLLGLAVGAVLRARRSAQSPVSPASRSSTDAVPRA